MLEEAGLADADLVIACTSRDEANIIAAMFARKLAPDARTIVRTENEEYLDVWRERQLDVDFVVSSERETALAVSQTIGVPAARQTDVFADGQVQIVEFDVEKPVAADERRSASAPARGTPYPGRLEGREHHPGRRDRHAPRRRDDPSPATGSSSSARRRPRRSGAGCSRRRGATVDDVVIFGGGRIGTATARALARSRASAFA